MLEIYDFKGERLLRVRAALEGLVQRGFRAGRPYRKGQTIMLHPSGARRTARS